MPVSFSGTEKVLTNHYEVLFNLLFHKILRDVH